MYKYSLAYLAIFITMTAVDWLWLGVIAKPMYQQGIGHLMSVKPNLVAAGIFYLLFPLGLMYFAVCSGGASAEWPRVLLSAALFGFFTYATYDLTNLAILRNWPVGLSLIDVAWGTFVTVLSASAGKFVFDTIARMT